MNSVRKIAEAAGVSISTVSLVMNRKPGVSEQTRQAVFDAIRQLEAEGNAARSNSASALSVVVLHPPVLDSYYVFSQVLQGIQAAAETNMLQLRLVANEPEMREDHIAYQYLSDPQLRPDGLILFGARQNEPILDHAQRSGLPCVVLGREARKYPVSGLGRDEEGCGYEAARYLLELGHRAIAFVGGEDGFDYVLNRRKGYQRALEESGVTNAPSWIQSGNGTDGTTAILKEAPEITAILFVNDSYAADGLPVLQDQGLTIPGDISVLSFDDTDIARKATPPLTSVCYHFFEEGQWAVKMLLDLIRFPHLERVHTLFKAELIQRGSCAPPSR